MIRDKNYENMFRYVKVTLYTFSMAVFLEYQVYYASSTNVTRLFAVMCKKD